MQNVTVKKAKLYAILQENRELHKKSYAGAVEEFYRAAQNIITAAFQSIPEGSVTVPYNTEVKNLSINLQAPRHYLREYDRAIHMLEMEVREDITLTAREFEQFFDDQWSWKETFDATRQSFRSFI